MSRLFLLGSFLFSFTIESFLTFVDTCDIDGNWWSSPNSKGLRSQRSNTPANGIPCWRLIGGSFLSGVKNSSSQIFDILSKIFEYSQKIPVKMYSNWHVANFILNSYALQLIKACFYSNLLVIRSIFLSFLQVMVVVVVVVVVYYINVKILPGFKYILWFLSLHTHTYTHTHFLSFFPFWREYALSSFRKNS